MVAQARGAYRVGNWRLIGQLRLRISAMRAQRNGIVNRQASLGKPWAIALLRQIRARQRMPQYRTIDLPRTSYSPLSVAYPRPRYTNWQAYWPQATYRPAPILRAGYHAFVPGQKGAQVPSHLSRFGIGDLSPDDVEGVVEPIDDLDGWMEDMRLPADPMARIAALGAIAAVAVAYTSKRKKTRQTAMGAALAATAATFWYGRKAMDEETETGDLGVPGSPVLPRRFYRKLATRRAGPTSFSAQRMAR